MGRPSVKEERTAEILDAYQECVARYGVEGATLDRVAERAGLARQLIRHHVGNREELLDALVERFFSESDAFIDELRDALPDRKRVDTLIKWFFDPNYSDPTTTLVSEALIAASVERPQLSKKLQHWNDSFIEYIGEELQQGYPGASADECAVVATGIATIYFSTDSLSPLGRMRTLRQNAKSACQILVGSLEKP